jgi:hypothetical protein
LIRVRSLSILSHAGPRATLTRDLSVGGEPSRRLAQGTFVHVRVNMYNRKQVSVQPVEPSCRSPARGMSRMIDFNQY